MTFEGNSPLPAIHSKPVLYLSTVILFFFSFPPFYSGFLAYIVLVPFFLILKQSEFREGFRTGYGLGLLTLGVFLHWLNWNTGAPMVQATGMYLGTIMYLALYWGSYGFLQAFINRRVGIRGFWAAPFLWTAIDFALSRGELGFTWHSFATTQTYYTSWIQYIEWTGMFGITFWVATLNVIFFFILINLQGEKHYNIRRLVTAAIVVFFIPLCFLPLVKNPTPEKVLKIAIIKPNIEPNQKWLEPGFAYKEIMDMTRSIDRKVDLIIWPETAIPVRLRQDHSRMKAIRQELALKGAALMTGIPDRKISTDNEESRYFNSIFLIRPDRETFTSYDKMHLVPFGEVVPSFLFFLKDLAMEVGAANYSSGDAMTVFHAPVWKDTALVDSVSLSGVVCLESIYPRIVRDGVVRGADALVIVTNDAWYDGTLEPLQHARIAILRAIENRIPIARCANSGVSCLIDAGGNWISEGANGRAEILYGNLNISDEETLYTRYGDWFAWICVSSAALLIGIHLVRRYVRKK